MNLNHLLVHAFGYDVAIIIKNLVIGATTFIVACFSCSLFHAYVTSLIRFDKNNELLRDGIVLVILERKVSRFKTKTRIVIPEGLTAFEYLQILILFVLHKLRIVKGAKLMRKDQRKARIVYYVLLIVFLIIALISLELSFSIMPYRH